MTKLKYERINNSPKSHNLSSNPDAFVLRRQPLIISQTVRVQGLARKLLLLLLASAQHAVGAPFICAVKKIMNVNKKSKERKKKKKTEK